MRKSKTIFVMMLLHFFCLSLASAVNIDRSITELIRQQWSGLSTDGSQGTEVVVGYGLEGEGYHRELVVSVHTEERHGGKETECLIVVNVTSNFYIDLDQISQMNAFGGPDMVASGEIDTERHAGDSTSHTVLVYGSLHGPETTIKVPLHLRYQATGSSPYFKAIIPTPHLLLKAQNGGGISLPCGPASSSHCHWHPSPISYSHPPLVATVPIGQNGHTVLVVMATLALTLGSALYLIHTILQKVN